MQSSHADTLKNTPNVMDLPALSQLLRDIAATEILSRFRDADPRAKSDGSLVTEADLAVQQGIERTLAERYPQIPLLGEEMTPEQQQALIDRPDASFWCLDPLDGTSNYACGFPGFAISLALIQKGQSTLALVLDPIRDECFTAAQGAGAFLNEQPIQPFAPGQQLDDCLAMMDLKRLPPERIPALFTPGSFRSQRNLGAVALEWCWLAAGRFQLYLHGGQKLWDYAAGRLIATEAGATSALFDPRGTQPDDQLTLDKRTAIAAATPTLFNDWLNLIQLPLRD